jgi:hypothetical protein
MAELQNFPKEQKGGPEPDLEAYGERCSHCGASLEAGGPNGLLALCGGCGCIFHQGEVVSYKRCETRNLVGVAELEQGVSG